MGAARAGAGVDEDAALVAAMRAGQPEGWEGVYRRYADRLLAYAHTLLADEQAAADALHDAFLTAGAHLDELEEPEQLRPWLYTIVRNAGQGRPRGRHHDVPADPVHAAVQTLSPADREVVCLAVEHDLSGPMLQRVLGEHAPARLARARRRFDHALGALLVARAGCPDLVLDGWDGRLTPSLRKRVTQHIAACTACAERSDPAALLAGWSPVFPPVGAEVWSRVGQSLAASWATADETDEFPAAPVDGGTVYTAGEFQPAVRSRQPLILAAAAVVLVVVVGVAIWASTRDAKRDTVQTGAPAAVPAPSAPSETVGSTPGTPAALQSPSPLGSVRAKRVVPSPATAAAVQAVPLEVTAYAVPQCNGGSWTLLVSATGDTELTTATVLYGTGRSQAMLVSGGMAAAQVPGLAGAAVTWAVRATAADGRTGTSISRTAGRPC